MDTVNAEAELNRFLDRQAGKVAEERAGQEHANALEQMRRDQERRHAEQHREYNRNLWICYFRTLARNHARLAQEHEAKAQKLEGDDAA